MNATISNQIEIFLAQANSRSLEDGVKILVKNLLSQDCQIYLNYSLGQNYSFSLMLEITLMPVQMNARFRCALNKESNQLPQPSHIM